MSKVTSKLQVILPKAIAERFNIKPGDQIEAAGETIRVVPAHKQTKSTILPRDRLKHFDRATERQRQREKTLDRTLLAASALTGRGWTRGVLYDEDPQSTDLIATFIKIAFPWQKELDRPPDLRLPTVMALTKTRSQTHGTRWL